MCGIQVEVHAFPGDSNYHSLKGVFFAFLLVQSVTKSTQGTFKMSETIFSSLLQSKKLVVDGNQKCLVTESKDYFVEDNGGKSIHITT